MPQTWMPTPGQVALIEVEGDDRSVAAVVIDEASGQLVIDLGGSIGVAGSVVASFFAPDALYRVRATASNHPGADGVVDLRVHDVERVQRRATPRARIELRATLSAFDAPGEHLASIPGRTVDLGVGGCRVRTATAFPAGCDPTLTIHLPDDSAVALLAAVVQATPVDGGWEYRLVFVSLEDDDARRLRAVVSSAVAVAP